jgi:hypothetical protein
MTHAQPRPQPGTTARARTAAAARAPAAQPDRTYGPTARPRPAAPTGMRPGPGVEGSQLPDLALYERLISDGIAAADARGSAVDHVTARRLAICLAARPNQLPVELRGSRRRTHRPRPRRLTRLPSANPSRFAHLS